MRKGIKIILVGGSCLLSVLLVGPFLIPIPPLEDTVAVESLSDPDSKFVEIDGIRVHYKQQGTGERTFILLHGFGASTYSWREIMGALAKQGTVIAYDRPGFGLTDRPLPGEWNGTSPYSSQGQVDLLIGLMDHFNIKNAVLVGNSAGGTVAVSTALQYPERVEALVLVDAAIYTSGGGPNWARFLFKTPQVNRLGVLIARQIQNLGDDFLRTAWHDPSKITPDIFLNYHKPLKIDNWDRALWQLTKDNGRAEFSQHLFELKIPVLVITGDDDRIVPTEDSLRLAREVPNAALAVIKDCGHVPQEECPQQTLKSINVFVEQLPGR